MADDNHTPIPHLLTESSTPTSSGQPTYTQSNVPKKPTPSGTQIGGKESEPLRPKMESLIQQEIGKNNESTVEEENNEKSGVKPVRQTPKISKDAEKGGLSLAPSAKPFPTIYDVKVPIYTDEQIEQNLHKSFWTGARWLAEFCKYVLWQSHIKLKKVGSKIIRQTT